MGKRTRMDRNDLEVLKGWYFFYLQNKRLYRHDKILYVISGRWCVQHKFFYAAHFDPSWQVDLVGSKSCNIVFEQSDYAHMNLLCPTSRGKIKLEATCFIWCHWGRRDSEYSNYMLAATELERLQGVAHHQSGLPRTSSYAFVHSRAHINELRERSSSFLVAPSRTRNLPDRVTHAVAEKRFPCFSSSSCRFLRRMASCTLPAGNLSAAPLMMGPESSQCWIPVIVFKETCLRYPPLVFWAAYTGARKVLVSLAY